MLPQSVVWFPLDITIFILSSPIIFIQFVPLIIYRVLVHIYVRIVFPNLISTSTLSQTFAFDVFSSKPDKRMVLGCGSITKVSGDISIDQLRSAAQIRLFEAKSKDGKLLYPSLTASPVSIGGYLYLKPIKTLNIEEMVHEVHPGTVPLSEFKYDYISERFPVTGPLFKLALYKSNGESYIIMKFHHSIFDCISMAHLFSKFCGLESPKQRWKEYNTFEILLIKIVAWIRYPRHIITQLYTMYKGKNLISRLSLNNSRMRVDSIELNFDSIKLLAKNTNVNLISLSNFFYGIMLRKIFEEKDLGDYMCTGIALPHLGSHYSEKGILGNFLQGVVLKVPVKLEPQLDALKECHTYYKNYINNGFVTTIGYVASSLWLGLLPHGYFKIFKSWIDETFGVKLMSSVYRIREKNPSSIFGFPVLEYLLPIINLGSYTNDFVFIMSSFGPKCNLTLISSCEIFPTEESLTNVLEYLKNQIESINKS